MLVRQDIVPAVGRCPICGRELAPNAAEGLCLRCLLRAGLDDPNSSAQSPVTADSASTFGRFFGDYELVREAGRGGMGIVYEARQFGTQRVVALKFLSAGALAGREAVHRFHTEAQAAAQLEHPCIVPVYEAGCHDGQYFLAMRFLAGGTLADQVTRGPLSPRQAAEILRQISGAVQFAHSRGVLHRDLKPGNILLDETGAPFVSDFGLARILSLDDPLTVSAAFLGTAAYMAPEQSLGTGGPTTTATDIFGLGAVLYALLTGRAPFQRPTFAETVLALQTEEPVPPSKVTPNGEAIPQDLETVCLKCLEKEPAKRYATAQELADDLGRFLGDEPISARPVNRLERTWRWCRRKPALATLVVLALLLVLVLGIGSPIAAYRINQARKQAQAGQERASTEAAKSKEVARFLEDMLQGVGPSKALGRDTTMLKDILDQTAARLGNELTNEPEVQIELRGYLIGIYHQLGLYEEMKRVAQENLRASMAVFGPEHLEVAEMLGKLGDAMMHLGKNAEAEKLIGEALEMCRRLLGDEHEEIAGMLSDLANVLMEQGKLAQCENLRHEVLARAIKTYGSEDPHVATALDLLATTLVEERKLDAAETPFRQAIALRRKLLGDQHPDLAISLRGLADLLQSQSRFAEAQPLLREALAIQRKVLGEDHFETLVSRNDLAAALFRQGALTEAETLFREVLATRRRLLGAEHPAVAASLNNLAVLLQDQGKWVEAESLHRQALAIRRSVFGNDHPDVAESLANLALTLKNQDKPADAEALLREGVDIQRKLPGQKLDSANNPLRLLVGLLLAQGRIAEAEPLLREVVAVARKSPENPVSILGSALLQLARVLQQQNNLIEAEGLYREGLAVEQQLPGTPPDLGNLLVDLALLLHQQRRYTDVETLYQEQLNGLRAKFPTDDPGLANALAVLTSTLLAEEKFNEAEPVARECLAIRELKIPQAWRTFSARGMLGTILLGQKKYAEAEPLLLSAYSGMKEHQANDSTVAESRAQASLRQAILDLTQLYEATGRPDQATEWRNKLPDSEESPATIPPVAPSPAHGLTNDPE